MEEEKHPCVITEDQGHVLLRLARLTITERFDKEKVREQLSSLLRDLSDGVFLKKKAVFVTLKKDGRLRGCIGSLTAADPLIEGVQRNALNAAFHDPRFTPLQKAELPLIEIELSVLTNSTPFHYENAADLVHGLRKGVDGVILRKGWASATFLPQVWEQLPDAEAFLNHLCLKAGLPAESWRQVGLLIETYQVQHFHEKRV